MPRVARSADTRESAARPKTYIPPSQLAHPKAPPGCTLRWVRVKSGAEDDDKSVANREHEGYRPVTVEEAQAWDPTWKGTSHRSGPFGGHVGRKDLVLMVNASENVEGRRVHDASKSRRQIQAIDQDMYRAAQSSPQHIAFDKPRRSTRSAHGVGASRPQFADDDD